MHDAVEVDPERGSGRTPASEPDEAEGGAGAVQPATREITDEEAEADVLAEIERNAGGLRRPALETIEPVEIERLRQEFADLGGDPEILRFNKGAQTSFVDATDRINVRGDVNPVEGTHTPVRDELEGRAWP